MGVCANDAEGRTAEIYLWPRLQELTEALPAS
jgi:hypothetical protein